MSAKLKASSLVITGLGKIEGSINAHLQGFVHGEKQGG